MAVGVCGAMCRCTFGAAPSSLVVLPKLPILICGLPVASVTDFIPMVNIMPFGMCSTLSNPSVASATAAAFGVLTPMPCVPVIVSPWVSTKPTVILPTGPAVQSDDMCMCAYGGVIKVSSPGQFVVS